jgi:hypothetical protein
MKRINEKGIKKRKNAKTKTPAEAGAVVSRRV